MLAQREELLGGELGIVERQMAVGHLRRQPCRKAGDRAGRARVVEGAGELGEAGGLGDHDAIDREAGGRQQQVDHPGADVAQGGCGVAGRLRRVEQGGKIGRALLGDIGAEQLGLAGEMVVDGAFGDAGRAGDVSHARPLVAVAREHPAGALQDGATLLARERFGCGHCGHNSGNREILPCR